MLEIAQRTQKGCTVSKQITSFASIAYERHKEASRATQLIPADGNVLPQSNVQLRDSSKYQLAISRLFAEYREKQLENVKVHTPTEGVVHKVGDLTLRYTPFEIVVYI